MSGVMRMPTLVSLAILFGVCLPAIAQETDPKTEVPELKVLDRYVGTWEHKVRVRTADNPIDGKIITGTAKGDWILRGRMLGLRLVWLPDNVHGMAVMTYDPAQREYCHWYFDSTGAIPRSFLHGQWDEANQVMTWKETNSDGGTTFQMNRFTDEKNYTWQIIVKDGAGQVTSQIDGQARRK